MIVDTINPSTRVGVSNLLKSMETVSMAKFNKDVDEMLNNIQEKYDRIIEKEEMYLEFFQHLFNALLTAKNDVFVRMIQRLKDSWNTGEDITPTELIDAASTKF